MRNDSRLSRMLHVLIHMAQTDEPVTSDVIATMLGTHAVVVRRVMAGARDCGFVAAVRGHGGGWKLGCSLERITLLDVYQAVGEPAVFALGATADHPDCLVEQAVNASVGQALQAAQALLLKRFGQVTVADIARQATARHGAGRP
ncbi:MAG: Rrf2 family transcriptional regulator [Aquincola tertiaricarbonis]|uniref:Rrf2 family transcriptional regulator n=1 Tax=Aquincola sp. J276 TaxID=2898432 RepID=UPI002151D877|nr:Rrf2 family transcriptional regulator [Aquincola sp. J276]MCR5867917.1 Rrf2 family transcriptional regulator [Aquincola sp. J276]